MSVHYSEYRINLYHGGFLSLTVLVLLTPSCGVYQVKTQVYASEDICAPLVTFRQESNTLYVCVSLSQHVARLFDWNNTAVCWESELLVGS